MAEEISRPRLGRGLAALIGDSGTEQASIERLRNTRRIPIAFLRPNPRNPRRFFDPEELQELTDSIREKGVIQPILVRTVSGEMDSYEIIAGERRWRAAQAANLHEVPVHLLEVDDREALEIAIIENVQRADLNALEEAMGYQELIDQFSYSQSDLARVVGKSRSHVANTVRLLKLPASVQTHLRDGKLSAGHARALLTSENPEKVAQEIVSKGLNVRQVEALAQAEAEKDGRQSKARPRLEKDTDTLALEKGLSDALGLVVTIDHRGAGGELRIRYKTIEQLDMVCRRLNG